MVLLSQQTPKYYNMDDRDSQLARGGKVFLGMFATKKEATSAYDAVALYFFGVWVKLEFPTDVASSVSIAAPIRIAS